MVSFYCERAIKKAIENGNALLKFISPNDVGITGSHQVGYYLPKKIFPTFTPHPPVKNTLEKHEVTVQWMEDFKTESVITWYGNGSRSEYRMTRFGKGFPFLAHDMVGNLLILIKDTESQFSAYILDLDDDIEEIQATLGVEVLESWALYLEGEEKTETEDDCIGRHFREFAMNLTEFPHGSSFSSTTWKALRECIPDFNRLPLDRALIKSMESEYKLFRMVERQLCQNEIIRVFRDVDDFLQTASSIMNRRKSRAGRSLENHVERLLVEAKVPHEVRPKKIDGKPDIVIPNEAAYFDSSYPVDKLIIVGVKTTCKDRWRQVLNEGKRVKQKHILTTQKGISVNQLNEMHQSGVTLVVPAELHKDFPKKSDISLLSIEGFVKSVRQTLN